MVSSSISRSVLDAPVRSNTARRAARLLARIGALVLARARARSDYRDMMELPDYLLRDVGVTRAEIASAQADSRTTLWPVLNRAPAERRR